MRIAVDGMGGDNAPFEVVKGCVKASLLTDNHIIIIGDEIKILDELSKYKYEHEKISIYHASQVIENEDAPVRAVRSKTDSSLVKGINLLKEKKADIFISAGNTGAIMAASLFILGRIDGIDRPAIAVTYPIVGKGISLLVDSGANTECKPNNIVEFAVMGSIYMEKVLNVENPKVGLINIGVEESKGTAVLKASYPMLKKSHINFYGNIEARDIQKGICDVLVCDGFTGNIVLKLTEGLAWSILKLIKRKFTDGLLPKVGTLFLSSKLKEIKTEFDYTEYGGAPILGVRGAVVKMHGSSDAKAVKNTILKGIDYAKNDVVKIIQDSVLELEDAVK